MYPESSEPGACNPLTQLKILFNGLTECSHVENVVYLYHCGIFI